MTEESKYPVTRQQLEEAFRDTLSREDLNGRRESRFSRAGIALTYKYAYRKPVSIVGVPYLIRENEEFGDMLELGLYADDWSAPTPQNFRDKSISIPVSS